MKRDAAFSSLFSLSTAAQHFLFIFLNTFIFMEIVNGGKLQFLRLNHRIALLTYVSTAARSLMGKIKEEEDSTVRGEKKYGNLLR